MLTIAGIAIGILALTVVGALAERLQTIVSRSTTLDAGTVLAFPERGSLILEMTPAFRHSLERLASDADVDAVYPEIILPYSIMREEESHFGPPSLIIGLPNTALARAANAVVIGAGRMLRADDRRVAVVGGAFAQEHHVGIGSLLSLYGNSYTVVGVEELGLTIFDQAVVVPFPDAQALLGQVIPPSALRPPRDAMSAVYVIAKPHVSTTRLAERITLLSGLRARDPAALAADLSTTTRIFDSIIFGSAAIALLVASFSIINTMTISVTERTREIGIRKAIGARDGDILRDFIIEAAVIGAVGGAIGVACGIGLSLVFDARSAAAGSLALFEVTPRLASAAFFFSIVLSAIAGIVPAIRASRMNPVEALRKHA